VGLPVGKIVGITLFGLIAVRIGKSDAFPPLTLPDLLTIGALGGIGFTVSLLLAELAFTGHPDIRDQAVLGVLAGSVISAIIAAILVVLVAARHRRRAAEEAAR
jgi:NhaA family Na+:H+ antiporter